jgi:hypothetical protein
MRGLAFPACCLALLGACRRAQDAPPVEDSAHHALLATIPLESPRGIDSLALAAEPAAPGGRARRLLVGMPGPAARVLVVDIAARAVQSVLEPARNDHTFGTAVEWVGDLDSDGEPDVAVGVPSDDLPKRAGCVLLYSSKSGSLIRELEGIEPGDEFGCSLSARGTMLVVGCPRLEGGGYACFDLRTSDPPVVKRCRADRPLGWQVLLADGDEGPASLVLVAWTDMIECRRIADDKPLWSYAPPAGWLQLASGNNPGEILVATRRAVSSFSNGDDPSMLLLLTLERGNCRLWAEPGGVAAVADTRGLVVLDEQAGLEAFEWTPRHRSWVARPDPRCNPYWSALCSLDSPPGRRVIAWAAAYSEPRGPAVGELRLYEVRN